MRNNHCAIDMPALFGDACKSVAIATDEDFKLRYDEEMGAFTIGTKLKFNISNIEGINNSSMLNDESSVLCDMYSIILIKKYSTISSNYNVNAIIDKKWT